VSEVPDFPLPSSPVYKNKYTYQPEPGPEADRLAQATQFGIIRRPGPYTGLSNDGPVSARTFTRPLSQQFTVSSNLPSASLDAFPRPYQVRPKPSIDTEKSTPWTDSTEYAWSPSTTATSAVMTPAYTSSKQAPTQDQTKSGWASLEATHAAERGRTGYMRHMHSNASLANPQTMTTREPSRPRSRTLSRTRSMTRSIRDYIRPGSSNERLQSISRPGTAKRSESRESRRSNASSGVLPAARNRFSWKSWRQSWQSLRSGVDSETEGDAGPRGRADKRRSKEDAKNSQVNLNRELPPLPGLDQWKGEEEADKPKHIASLWNSKALKRRSQDFNKRQSGDLSKRRSGDLSKRRSGDVSKMLLPESAVDVVEPSIPEVEPLQIDVIEEVPSTLAVKPISGTPAAAIPKGSPKVNRKPLPLTKSQSPPADSVLGDQDRSGSTRSVAKSPVEVRIPTGYHTANASLSPLPVLDGELVEIAPSATVMDTLADSLPQALDMECDESETAAFSPTKRRPSKLDLDGIAHASPKLYDRAFNQENGETNFVERNMSIDNYSRATASKYKYADEISTLSSPPPVPPKDAEKKSRWPFKPKNKRQTTWMDEMEKLGIKDGLLLTDDLQGSPIVRY